VNLPLCQTYKSQFGINLLTLGCLGSYLKRARVMLVFLKMSMDPPKHYVFLFGVSSTEKPMNMSNKVMTTPQRETPKDEQMEQATYKTMSYKHWKYSPPHWSTCCASTGKLLVSTHNFSFIDWGPHGHFVLKIGIGRSVIILTKLFGKIVHYIENII
jgi:hypothetical protein